MRKLHVTIVATLLAGAAVLGAVAVTHTVRLGAARQQSSNASVQARTEQLDRLQASLERALAQRPAARAPRIVYHRPSPVVVVRHTARGDDGGAFEGGDD